MPWSVTYIKDENYVLVANQGSFTYDDYKQQTKDAWTMAKRYKTKAILVDDSKLENRAALFDVFDFPNYYTSIGIDKTIRIAVFVPEDKMTERFSFYENVCRNRGWNVKIFPDKQMAVNWLKNKE